MGSIAPGEVLPHGDPILFVDRLALWSKDGTDGATGFGTVGTEISGIVSPVQLGESYQCENAICTPFETAGPDHPIYEGHFGITPGVVVLNALAGDGRDVVAVSSVTWKAPVPPKASGIIMVEPVPESENSEDRSPFQGTVLLDKGSDRVVAMKATGVVASESQEGSPMRLWSLEVAAQAAGALVIHKLRATWKSEGREDIPEQIVPLFRRAEGVQIPGLVNPEARLMARFELGAMKPGRVTTGKATKVRVAHAGKPNEGDILTADSISFAA